MSVPQPQVSLIEMSEIIQCARSSFKQVNPRKFWNNTCVTDRNRSNFYRKRQTQCAFLLLSSISPQAENLITFFSCSEVRSTGRCHNLFTPQNLIAICTRKLKEKTKNEIAAGIQEEFPGTEYTGVLWYDITSMSQDKTWNCSSPSISGAGRNCSAFSSSPGFIS